MFVYRIPVEPKGVDAMLICVTNTAHKCCKLVNENIPKDWGIRITPAYIAAVAGVVTPTSSLYSMYMEKIEGEECKLVFDKSLTSENIQMRIMERINFPISDTLAGIFIPIPISKATDFIDLYRQHVPDKDAELKFAKQFQSTSNATTTQKAKISKAKENSKKGKANRTIRALE